MSAAVTKMEQPEPPRRAEGDAMVSMLERVLLDDKVPVERLERLLELQDRERQRQAKAVFSERMSAAQAEMRAVRMDKKNDQTKSRYASYAALDDLVRPIYTKHGFSVTFITEPALTPDMIRIVALVENAGYERSYPIEMPCDGKGARGGDVMTKTHAVKSAVTYGKATLLPMIFNLAVTDRADDDGNGASNDAPLERITAEQVKTLRAEMTSRAVDEMKFCEFAHIERLEDLSAGIFESALRNVQRKPKTEARNG